MQKYGGFTDVAKMLGVTRQQVYIWWKRRNRNSFPDRYDVLVPSKGKSAKMFVMTEVASWHSTYVPAQGGRPPKVLHPVLMQEGRDG